MTKGTGKKPAAFAYIFENPDEAKPAQTKLFRFHKDSDKATVGAYTAGDTVVVSTWAAANAQPTLNDCFENPS